MSRTTSLRAEFSLSLATTEKLYRAKVGYFERPFVSNEPYDYRVIHAVNPYDFMITIEDLAQHQNEVQLRKALALCGQQVIRDKGAVAIEPQLFYVGMPLLMQEGELKKSGPITLSRGEVLRIEGDHLTIHRVDLGGVRTLPKTEVYPISVQALRVPKLGIPCILSQIRPDKDNVWPTDRDYKKDLTGVESRKVTFIDYFPKTKAYEVFLEVDDVNVALKYYHLEVAAPMALKMIPTGAYPVPDYENWIGLKVITFGVKVFQQQQGAKKNVRVVLQMDPEVVNEMQEKIVKYVSTAPKGLDFIREVGSPVLAQWNGEYFRAKILGKMPGDRWRVEFVDYREESEVKSGEMMKIPPELVQQAEGAVVCQLTELLYVEDFKEMDKLKGLVENQDLYAVVDAADPEVFGPELLVSLFQPTEEYNGKSTSFLDILQIPDRVPIIKEILQMMEPIPKDWEPLFLRSLLCAPNQYHPGATVSMINDWDSIFLQFDGAEDFTAQLSAELTRFYKNGGCSAHDRDKWFGLSPTIVGQWVASPIPDDDIAVLHRGLVVEEQEGRLLVLFVDYGNTDEVKKSEVWPLHVYFAKDPLAAVEVAVKI